jgi:sugar phosphate permease
MFWTTIINKLTGTYPEGKVYYGWVIVGVIFLSTIASAIQLNPTIGVFVKPITAEFGWSRSDLAGAVTIGTIFGGILAVLTGRIVDKFGPRWVLFFGFLILGTLLIGMGMIQNLWHFYIITIISRMILQGVINITCQTVATKWFVRLRGRAVALAAAGERVGNGVVPFLAQILIINQGWRTASWVIGISAWAITLGPTAIWLRRSPQDMNLVPDGSHNPPLTIIKPQFSLSDALGTKSFYLLGAAFSIASFIDTGINFSLNPYLIDQFLNEKNSVTVIAIWAFSGIAGSLIAGFLAEHLKSQFILLGCYIGIAIGVLLLMSVNSLQTGIIFGLTHGAFFGAVILMQQLILAEYFGSDSIATIRGAIAPWQMTGNAFGPLAASLVFDTSGSYMGIFRAYLILLLIIWIGISFATKPKLNTKYKHF